jgi:hypothetical protein
MQVITMQWEVLLKYERKNLATGMQVILVQWELLLAI